MSYSHRTISVCLLLGCIELLAAHLHAGFEAGVDVLFLRPSTCDLNTAIEDNRSLQEIVDDLREALPQGTQEGISCHYCWGWSLFAAYVNECTRWDIRAQYTQLHSHRASADEGEKVFWPTFGQPRFLGLPLSQGRLAARARNDYDAAEVQVGRRAMLSTHLWARQFLALHWAYIDHSLQAHFQGFTPAVFFSPPAARNTDILVTEASHTWLLGPRLGFEAIYDLSYGFGVGGRAIIGILAGEGRGKYTENGTSAIVEISTADVRLEERLGSRLALAPTVDFRLGANYTYCCDCLGFVVELGYAFISYVNALHRIIYNDASATANVDCTSYNLDGLYLNLTLVL